MPTPPPWWNDTQVAPLAQLRSALSSGQSDTASEPSRIPSVSRLGLATLPEVEVVAPDHDRRLELPRRHHLVERQPEPVTVAQSHPADAGGKPLERNARARHVEPVVQVRGIGHQLLHLGIGAVDVLRVARQRGPAKRPDAAAEHRPDIGRHEAGEIERVGHPHVARHLANVVAVVDRRHAGMAELEHGAYVHRHRLLGRLLDPLGIALAPLLPLLQGPALRQVAVDRVMRRGLVGDGVRLTPRRTNSGTMSAALPRTPTENGLRSAHERSIIVSASSRSFAWASR